MTQLAQENCPTSKSGLSRRLHRQEKGNQNGERCSRQLRALRGKSRGANGGRKEPGSIAGLGVGLGVGLGAELAGREQTKR